MTANTEVTSIAQKYADYLGVTGLFEHSGAEGLGENLAAIWQSSEPDLSDCSGIKYFLNKK